MNAPAEQPDPSSTPTKAERVGNLVARWHSQLVSLKHTRVFVIARNDLEAIIDWYSELAPGVSQPPRPACQCPCHRDPLPPGPLYHSAPCCELVTEVQVLEEQAELKQRQELEWAAFEVFHESARCVKCGHESAIVQFCSPVSRHIPTALGVQPYQCPITLLNQRDHLHRVCERCQFMWVERPIDDRS